MYPPELEKLIDYAIADGTLTDLKRNVLLKKAEALGIDLDEFQLVLEGRLFEKKNTPPQPSQVSTPPSPVKTSKHGDIKKCPACGAMVTALSTKCASCEYVFSNIQATSSMQEIFRRLDEIESTRDDKVTVGAVIGGFLKNSLGGGAIAQALGAVSKTDKRKKEIISSFPIPNTKEDILEFLSLAFPKAKAEGNFFTKNNDPERIEHNEFVPVWKAKCGQVIIKAKFLLKDDENALEQVLACAKKLGIK
jgi:hypothetical protein